MRSFFSPVFAFLLIGCRSGSVVLGPPVDDEVEAGDPDNDTTDGDITDDGSDGGDGDGDGEQEEEEEEPPFPYLGEYDGEMEIIFSSTEWGSFEVAFCELFVIIEEDGLLDGEADCRLVGGGGGGGGGDASSRFDGEVDDQGNVTGELNLKGLPLEMSGEAREEGELDLFFSFYDPQLGGEMSGEALLMR